MASEYRRRRIRRKTSREIGVYVSSSGSVRINWRRFEGCRPGDSPTKALSCRPGTTYRDDEPIFRPDLHLRHLWRRVSLRASRGRCLLLVREAECLRRPGRGTRHRLLVPGVRRLRGDLAVHRTLHPRPRDRAVPRLPPIDRRDHGVVATLPPRAQERRPTRPLRHPDRRRDPRPQPVVFGYSLRLSPGAGAIPQRSPDGSRSRRRRQDGPTRSDRAAG